MSISLTLYWFSCLKSASVFGRCARCVLFSLHLYVCVTRYWLVHGCKYRVGSPDLTSIRKPCRVEKVGDKTGKESVSMGRRNRSTKVGAVIDNLQGFTFYFLASSFPLYASSFLAAMPLFLNLFESRPRLGQRLCLPTPGMRNWDVKIDVE